LDAVLYTQWLAGFLQQQQHHMPSWQTFVSLMRHCDKQLRPAASWQALCVGHAYQWCFQIAGIAGVVLDVCQHEAWFVLAHNRQGPALDARQSEADHLLAVASHCMRKRCLHVDTAAVQREVNVCKAACTTVLWGEA
jgi:hypothetical protein